MPKICPVCGATAVREEGESAIRCTGIECPAKLFRNLVHFVSREAMNIDGLGENIIAQLQKKNLISNIADIYDLTFEQIAIVAILLVSAIANVLSNLITMETIMTYKKK